MPQTATINTGQDSIAVLVFSNGATLQLGAETELVLQGFLQEPFSSTITLSQLKDEPSSSRSTLALNRGDIVGNISMLKIAKGSSFIVQTPVGTADVLGGTFRAVFRAEGVNQFLFSLSNIEGKVHFTQPTGHGAASGAGKAVVVSPGQEIKFTVGVSQNSQGQNEVSPPPNAAAPRPPADQEHIIPPTVATPRK